MENTGEHENDRDKWFRNRTIQAALITGAFMLLAAALTTPLWVPFINNNPQSLNDSENIPLEPKKGDDSSSKSILKDPNNSTRDYGSHVENELKDETAAETLRRHLEKSRKIEAEVFEEEQNSKSVFVPGAAVLEIFKADSIETIPKLPVIRSYWEQDLTFSGYFLLPERASEIGRNSPYVAKFSFYYEAKQLGKYGFTINHFSGNSPFEKGNTCKLTIGRFDIVKVDNEQVGQGVCNLTKGFHRFDFWLVSKVPYWQDIPGKQMANFEVKVLTPDAFDAQPITKDMMLLKKE